MCKLSNRDHTILANLRQKERGLVATQLGITRETLDKRLSRVRRRREDCKKYLQLTDQYKRELYPRRKGE